MGIKRIVDTSFWTDGKVDEFTPEDKYFMLYLLTNPFSTQLGIYEISVKQVAFHMGYSIDAVKALIERFENNYEMIVFSKQTNEIAIKNFLRHSIIKGGAPVRDCLIKEMKKVKNKDLISIVFAHIKGSENLNETVKNIIAEYEEKNGTLSYSNEKHNDNDNDNENENEVSLATIRGRIVNDSLFEEIKTDILDNKGDGDKACEWCGSKTTILHKHHYPVPKRLGGTKTVAICSNCHSEFHSKEREMFGGSYIELDEPKKTTTKSSKPQKQQRGEFHHVLLTEEQEDKLIEEYGLEFTLKAITFLDEYIEENKETKSEYKKKNHYLCIRRWVIDAVKEKEEKAIKKGEAPKPRYGNFDPKDAFEKAIARSYPEEPKTAGNDEVVRERADKLKLLLS